MRLLSHPWGHGLVAGLLLCAVACDGPDAEPTTEERSERDSGTPPGDDAGPQRDASRDGGPDARPDAEPDPDDPRTGLGDGEIAGAGAGGAAGSTGGTTGSTGGLGDGAAFAGEDALGISVGAGSVVGSGNGSVEAGILTAGAWDDNRNFERFLEYWQEHQATEGDGALELSRDEHEAAHQAFSGERSAHETLDVALVVDATGSMGDEMRYLQAEFDAISRTIEEAHPGAAQRWSLVVYRDTTDEYVVRWFDFRDDADEFREKLAEQSAGGGGDYPEASHAALDTMTQLAWRDGDATARLAFWLADAPHHAAEAQAMSEALRTAAGLDIHIYPVASSGVDELTELSMRSAAQLTGGRYLFLTDDSGVGGAHKEPSLPCYYVTKLDDAIVRMVDIEMSGMYVEPTEEQILRTGGDPQDGACTLESGETVSLF